MSVILDILMCADNVICKMKTSNVCESGHSFPQTGLLAAKRDSLYFCPARTLIMTCQIWLASRSCQGMFQVQPSLPWLGMDLPSCLRCL